MKNHSDHRQFSTIKELSSNPLLTTPHDVVTPNILSFFTYGTFFVLLILSASLFFVPWVQTAIGSGKVIGLYANERQQNIQAPFDGRIQHWYVNEGVRVRQGDPIVDIIDLDPLIIDRLMQEKSAAEEKLKASELARATSLKNVERQRILANKGLSSQRAVELAEIEYQKLTSDVSSAISELTRVEGRLSRQSSQTIVAPRDGIIMRIVAPQGTSVLVKSGEPLARLVPETDSFAVEIKISGKDLPLVSEGRHVRLQFEGWPAIQFTGWPSVAVGTFAGIVKIIDASDDGTGSFRVIIISENKNDWPTFPYLRQGVRAYGWVLLDTVPLGWEIWRQLNGFPATINNNENVNAK